MDPVTSFAATGGEAATRPAATARETASAAAEGVFGLAGSPTTLIGTGLLGTILILERCKHGETRIFLIIQPSTVILFDNAVHVCVIPYIPAFKDSPLATRPPFSSKPFTLTRGRSRCSTCQRHHCSRSVENGSRKTLVVELPQYRHPLKTLGVYGDHKRIMGIPLKDSLMRKPWKPPKSERFSSCGPEKLLWT